MDIRKDLFGRAVLTATPPEKLDAKYVAEVMQKNIDALKLNFEESDYLWQFYKGNQPILSRTKEIRSDINNIIVENRAAEVVQFKIGYEFAQAPIYTNVGESESEPINALNKYARLDGKDAKVAALSELFFTIGTSHYICLPNESESADDAPYISQALRDAFVIYSNEFDKKPLMAGKYATQKVKDGDSYKSKHIYGIYTENMYYTFSFESDTYDFTEAKLGKELTEESNPLGMIPIVEYPLNENRIGYVELCLHLFHAINTVASNRIDGIEQFVQALLVFTNTDLPIERDSEGKPIIENGVEKRVLPKSGDAIFIEGRPGLPADVKHLVAQLDQSQVQVTKDDLLEAMYEICGVPSRNDRSGGGDTGQAVILRDGWGAAEARAKTTEKFFKKSEMEHLRIVLKICRETVRSEIGELTLGDITPCLQRTRNDNMPIKANVLKVLLDCGVAPEIAYESCEVFPDSALAWKKSKEFQDADAAWIESRVRMARKLPENDV